MSKTVIQIINVVQNAGTSKKTGLVYDMRFAQCIVHQVNKETGAIEPLVGELLLPKAFNDTKPGYYEADFELAIGQDKRIGSVVCALAPYVPKPKADPLAPDRKAA